MTTPPLASRTRLDRGAELSEMYRRAQEASDAIRLEIGDPCFDTPEHVVEAAAAEANSGGTHYTAIPGCVPLRDAIASKMRRENGTDTEPEQVVVTTGGSEALLLALQTIVDPGQSVVIPTPAWTSYTVQTKAAGGDPVYVPLSPEDGFRLDVDRVTDAIDDETAAVILCSPSNPTGVVYDPAALREVAAVAAAHDAFVIADEVYERITFEGTRESLRAHVDDPANVIAVNSFSKAYAMTGWRLGWLVADEPVVSGVTTMRLGTSLCPSSVAQHAGLAALKGDQTPFESMLSAYEDRRDYVLDRLDSIPAVSAVRPDGTFYVLIDVRSLPGTSVDLATQLLEDYGVATAPGIAFGRTGNGFLRLTFAAAVADLERGLDRFDAFVRERAST